jgi:FkbH-like protein
MTETAQPLERIGLLADFNAQNFAAILRKAAGSSGLECVTAPFGQTAQVLLDAADEFWSKPYEAVVVWTQPESAVREFQKVLAFEEFHDDALLGEVDAFCDLLRRIPAAVRTVLIPTWTVAAHERGLGPLDMADNSGVANALLRMNLRLVEQLGGTPRMLLFDGRSWIAGAGAVNPKLWYMAKTPFANAVFQEAAADIFAALEGIRGRSKKVLVVDLDNTLWGGTVGDEGWQKLRLGGHDALGEAFVDFQKQLKRLTRRGVVLAIASKNEESVALEAIGRHPEMVLKAEDFAAWRINWGDKAANIAELMAELNLGLDSAVFLDDSAFERGRVREALPQVFVPELPVDPMEYPAFVAKLRCFDNPHLSREDRKRTTMYVADRQRVAVKAEFHSLEEWLQALELRIQIESLTEANLERAAQLLNKTNQMNLSTRRMTAAELLAWSKGPRQFLWTFRATDKFGDYGLCGIASIVQRGQDAQLLDFLLSCRVMGRGVEETMLGHVAQVARDLNCQALVAEYLPTPKNAPCQKWFQKQPAVQSEGGKFTFSLRDLVCIPAHVQVITGSES